jgi:basic amino acid/polyamine antiporter, APA family
VIGEDRYLIPPVHISERYSVSLSTAQLTAIAVIVLLTWANSRGVHYGKIVQNLFTTAKLAALFGLILAGFTFGWNKSAVHANFGDLWTRHNFIPVSAGVSAATAFGLLAAICVSQSGSLFSADSWHDVTFAGAEVREPRRTLPLALAGGTVIVIVLYLLANVAYLITLPLSAIQHAPSDRVATAMLSAIFPVWGSTAMAIAIMISAFGCVNSLVLAGPRVYYAMARDGLFFSQAATLNRAKVPGRSLLIQCVWSAALVLPRTFDRAAGQYGNLYSNLLDYVISAALIFYIAAIAGVFRLRHLRPTAERPYRTLGYPIVPGLYIIGAAVVLSALFVYRPATTWPGLLIVLAGLPVFWVAKRKLHKQAN